VKGNNPLCIFGKH